ncbi:MAG TPA: hypothetical protein VJ521_15770, partial [Acidobacteriota bacterium]|nr:hypothetical protein [Acidobacteriota bacterium]
FRYLYLRSSKYLYAAWAVCAVVSLAFLIRAYAQYFPLIGLRQTRAEYLRQNLDYYPIAEMLNGRPNEKVLLLGESRIAYYSRPVIAAGIYDRSPFHRQLMESGSKSDLLRRFRSEGIRYVVYNETEFAARYGQKGVVPLPDEKRSMMKELTATSTKRLIRSENVSLYQIEDRDAW